jgi:hypothetical protein
MGSAGGSPTSRPDALDDRPFARPTDQFVRDASKDRRCVGQNGLNQVHALLLDAALLGSLFLRRPPTIVRCHNRNDTPARRITEARVDAWIELLRLQIRRHNRGEPLVVTMVQQLINFSRAYGVALSVPRSSKISSVTVRTNSKRAS